MSDEINVVERTQVIVVDPSSGSVSVISAGPVGPMGPAGVDAIQYEDSITVAEGDATTTGQTLTNAGTLELNLPVGRFDVDVLLRVSTSAVTTGTKYALTMTSGTATGDVLMSGTATATTSAEASVGLGTATPTAFLTASGISGVVRMRAHVNVTVAGVLNVQHLKVTSGTSTVLVGSVIRAREIPV